MTGLVLRVAPCPEAPVARACHHHPVRQVRVMFSELEARIALLEAENNLRKNEHMMSHKVKFPPKKKPDTPKTIGDLQIL